MCYLAMCQPPPAHLSFGPFLCMAARSNGFPKRGGKKSPYFHLEMSTCCGYEAPCGLFIKEHLNLQHCMSNRDVYMLRAQGYGF